MVLSKLKKPLDPSIVQYCYFKQMQHAKLLVEDTVQYKRAAFRDDASDYSFWVPLRSGKQMPPDDK